MALKLPKYIEVKVTDQDILDGKVMACERCPIALAVKRIFPTAQCVEAFFGEIVLWFVDRNAITEQSDTSVVRYTLPAAASEFIRQFDSKKPVKAFSFEMGHCFGPNVVTHEMETFE